MSWTLRVVTGLGLLLISAGTLRADFITIGPVFGGVQLLHAEFDLAWDPVAAAAGGPGFILGNASGTWSGGGLCTWEFSASIFGGENYNEGADQYTLRTSWGDGWTPFPILVQNTFVFGFGDGTSLVVYPPFTNVPYTDPNGITYLFTAAASGFRDTAADTSGSAHIIFDLSRAAVPEPRTETLLLGAALFLLGFGRVIRKRISAK